MCSSPDRAGLGLSLDRGIVLCFWARHLKSHSTSPHPDLEIGTGGLHAGVTVRLIGPLHDPVTWYGINYDATQLTQWEFRNKEKPG